MSKDPVLTQYLLQTNDMINPFRVDKSQPQTLLWNLLISEHIELFRVHWKVDGQLPQLPPEYPWSIPGELI